MPPANSRRCAKPWKPNSLRCAASCSKKPGRWHSSRPVSKTSHRSTASKSENWKRGWPSNNRSPNSRLANWSKLVSRANALQQQVEALQAELQLTQADGASQAEQIRQEYAARLETANALLAAKSAELAKSGAVRANVEESLRAEITRLNNEMQSRTAALQSREDELDRVRAEMTSVQNRIVQLESVTRAHRKRSARDQPGQKWSGERPRRPAQRTATKIRCRDATTNGHG